MTDRDQFAAAALTGIIANEGEGPSLPNTCAYAYRIADAMLRARNGAVDSRETVPITTHDAVPAAKDQLPEGDHASVGGGSDRSDKPAPRPAVVTGNTQFPKPFVLERDHDVSGVSGTGVVAQGVEFADGTVALRWTSKWPTSVVFHERGIDAVIAVHGHSGNTRLVWQSVTEPMPKGKRAEASQQEPAAWGLPNADGDVLWATSLDRENLERHCPIGQSLIPLYRHPQPTTNHDAVPAAIVSTTDENSLHAASELGNPGAASRQGEVTGNTREPVAWAVIERCDPCPFALFTSRYDAKLHASRKNDIGLRNCEAVPLYRQPTLTDAERECLEWAEEIAGNCEEFDRVDTLRILLERLK